MITVALTRAEMEALRAGDLGVRGPTFAVTPALLAAHGYGPKELEDAEYAALTYAGIAALTRGERRWVAVLELDVEPSASAYGLVEGPALRWSAVTAIFTDEPESVAPLAALSRQVAGRPLEQVLADAAVLDAVEEHDLLWYGPDELDRID